MYRYLEETWFEQEVLVATKPRLDVFENIFEENQGWIIESGWRIRLDYCNSLLCRSPISPINYKYRVTYSNIETYTVYSKYIFAVILNRTRKCSLLSSTYLSQHWYPMVYHPKYSLQNLKIEK